MVKHSKRLVCRVDCCRKTVNCLCWSGECLPLGEDYSVWYYNKSLCRADLQDRQNDIFAFRIEFRRWRGDSLYGIFNKLFLQI